MNELETRIAEWHLANPTKGAPTWKTLGTDYLNGKRAYAALLGNGTLTYVREVKIAKSGTRRLMRRITHKDNI